MSTPEQQERRKPKFDGTLNLGHLLQLIVLIVGFLTWFSTSRVQSALIDARVTALESNNREVRDTMRDMSQQLTKVSLAQERMAASLEYLAKKAN